MQGLISCLSAAVFAIPAVKWNEMLLSWNWIEAQLDLPIVHIVPPYESKPTQLETKAYLLNSERKAEPLTCLIRSRYLTNTFLTGFIYVHVDVDVFFANTAF